MHLPSRVFRLDAPPFGVTLPAVCQPTRPRAAQKINLRRPDIMEAVQAQVLSHYRSELVERIRANGNVLSAGD